MVLCLRLRIRRGIEDMFYRFGVNSSSDIPSTPAVELGPREEDISGGDWSYREAAGSSMRLSTITKPDISIAVRAVPPRHSDDPTQGCWKAAMEICGKFSQDQGFGVDVCAGFGIGCDCV